MLAVERSTDVRGGDDQWLLTTETRTSINQMEVCYRWLTNDTWKFSCAATLWLGLFSARCTQGDASNIPAKVSGVVKYIAPMKGNTGFKIVQRQ